MAKEVKTKEISKTHKTIVELLNNSGIYNFNGGIQLFTNQFREDYGVSINYMSTGLKIHCSQVDPNELIDDDLIRICKTFECML